MDYSKLADLSQINSVGAMTKGLAQWISTLRKMDYEEILSVLEEKTVAGINLFHGQLVSVGGTVNYFRGSVATTATSFTNMANFTKPTNEFSLILGMRFKTGLNANVNATAWTNGLALAADQNATFDFVVNGVKKLDAIPLFSSIPAAEDVDQGYIQYDQPILIGDQEPFNIPVTFENAPAATTNLMIELLGIGTIS